MLKIEYQRQFLKDYARALKRGLDKDKLVEVLNLLVEQKALPRRNKDQKLVNSRDYKNCRECHIQPDWLLVYKIEECSLILKLIRTGAHRDLFC